MIEVLALHRHRGGGTLLATARVRIGPITISGIPILRSNHAEGRPWLGWPQAPLRRKADGSGSGWVPIVEITEPALREAVRRACIAALEA